MPLWKSHSRGPQGPALLGAAAWEGWVPSLSQQTNAALQAPGQTSRTEACAAHPKLSQHQSPHGDGPEAGRGCQPGRTLVQGAAAASCANTSFLWGQTAWQHKQASTFSKWRRNHGVSSEKCLTTMRTGCAGCCVPVPPGAVCRRQKQPGPRQDPLSAPHIQCRRPAPSQRSQEGPEPHPCTRTLCRFLSLNPVQQHLLVSPRLGEE